MDGEIYAALENFGQKCEAFIYAIGDRLEAMFHGLLGKVGELGVAAGDKLGDLGSSVKQGISNAVSPSVGAPTKSVPTPALERSPQQDVAPPDRTSQVADLVGGLNLSDDIGSQFQCEDFGTETFSATEMGCASPLSMGAGQMQVKAPHAKSMMMSM